MTHTHTSKHFSEGFISTFTLKIQFLLKILVHVSVTLKQSYSYVHYQVDPSLFLLLSDIELLIVYGMYESNGY